MSAIEALKNRGKKPEPKEPEPSSETAPEFSETASEPSAELETVNEEEAALEELRRAVGPRANTLMRTAVKVAREFSSYEQSGTLLDDTIMSMRQSGMSHRKIAAELGTMSEDQVAERLATMYTKMEQVTSAEYRMLQVGRLEQVINMCWDLASTGSSDHIDLLIKAIERLNKMFELEKESTKVQVEIVTNAQAVMLMSIVSGVLGVITSDERITKVIPIEDLQTMTARALDVAEAEIVDENGEVRVI